jgi:hypothetical protein
MIASSTQAPFARPWSAAAASLVPRAAFLAAIAITDIWVDYKSISLVALIAASPVYLGFVALPSLFPLAAAPPGWMRLTVLTVMTAVAVIAGVLVVTSDDAQAGLAVLLVPYLGVPLGALVWVARTAMNARRTTSPERGEDAVSSLARPSDRLAALAIDITVVAAMLVVPLTAISHAKQEVAAAVVGIAAGTIYLGGPIAAFGRAVHPPAESRRRSNRYAPRPRSGARAKHHCRAGSRGGSDDHPRDRWPRRADGRDYGRSYLDGPPVAHRRCQKPAVISCCDVFARLRTAPEAPPAGRALAPAQPAPLDRLEHDPATRWVADSWVAD